MSYFHLGISRLRSRHVRDAEDDFKESLQRAQDNEIPKIQDGLGCCYMAMEKYQQAIAEFNSAIEKEPDNVEFLKNRAQCYFNMERFDEATADLAKASNASPADSQILYKQGLTYFAYKKYKKCIKTMKEALKYQPHMTYEADIYYHLGLAYCRLEKFEKSIFPFTKCVERIPSDLRYIHERAKAF